MIDRHMKVLVCGGRDYNDRAKVWRVLDEYQDRHGSLTIIQGDCPTGADHWAKEWTYGQPTVTRLDYPAKWEDLSHPGRRVKRRADGKFYDAAAGPRRNAEMLDECPDIILAFPGGTGTASLIKMVRRAGYIRIDSIDPDVQSWEAPLFQSPRNTKPR
jgi:hypothetical protein